MNHFFIAGIGTDVGKTLVSAILCEAWGTDYWKPVQAGSLDRTDKMEVSSLVSNPACRFHPETYLLPLPMSPHASALHSGITIDPQSIQLPQTNNNLIIEGAGGLMVPLTHDFLVVDLIAQLKTSTILVSRHYLGSINHTLLSFELLKSRNMPVKGIIFNGNENPDTEQVILRHTGLRFLGRIRQTEKKPDRNFVNDQAAEFAEI